MAQKKRVLIVDDEPMVGTVISRIVERFGSIPVFARSGQEAIAKLKEAQEPFDVLLVDLVMADITGWDLLDMIRNYPLHAKADVVIITGAKLSEDEELKLLQRAKSILNKADFSTASIQRLLSA